MSQNNNTNKEVSREILKLLVGQPIVINNDYEIQNNKGAILKVKKGDRGYVDSHKRLHYTSGVARGQIIKIPDEEVELCGLQCDEISASIFKSLDREFDMEEILEANDINRDEFISFVVDALIKYN